MLDRNKMSDFIPDRSNNNQSRKEHNHLTCKDKTCEWHSPQEKKEECCEKCCDRDQDNNRVDRCVMETCPCLCTLIKLQITL